MPPYDKNRIVIMRHFLSVLLFVLVLANMSCAKAQDLLRSGQIKEIRDSLDAISISEPQYYNYKSEVTLTVKNQTQWDELSQILKTLLKKGNRNIEVKVVAKELVYGGTMQGIEGINMPEANIRIHANYTRMIPAGPVFRGLGSKKNATHFICKYDGFAWNDVYLDEKDRKLSLLGESFQIKTPIEEVISEGKEDVLNNDGSIYNTITKVWRFQTNLPDLNEEECKDFYILLTRHWTSMRHQVLKVEKGYLYFRLKSDEAPSLYQMVMDPNSDSKVYKTNPRCRYFNCPESDGIYIKSGNIYIPKSLNEVRIGKGARLFTVSSCKLNSFEISGFDVKGAGNLTCMYISNSIFKDQMWIRDNTFTNMSANVILARGSENVCIYNNIVKDTRTTALSCSGSNISIWKNNLKDIGLMYNTMALSFGGTNIHVFENNVEDFNYSGISCGNTLPNDKSSPLTYIIERNIISHSEAFVAHYLERTVADGGGIYIGPQNTRGIIRNNVIRNITGIHSNRGIFLDDGAKNLAIYGNLVQNTANSYDIALRYCTTYSSGIPDHNTNNVIIHNIMTGYYRFEGRQDEDNCFVGGNVLLNGQNRGKDKLMVRRKYNDFIINSLDEIYAIDSIRLDNFIKDIIERL